MRTLQIVNIVCAVTIADQELFTFVLTMPPKKKLKRPDNQGLISNLFKSSTQDKPFNPVSSQTLPGPESDKQPVTNVTESDSTQIVDRVSSSEQSLPSTSDETSSSVWLRLASSCHYIQLTANVLSVSRIRSSQKAVPT